MKRWVAVVPAVAFFAFAAQAGAETATTITTIHTVSVVGIGKVPISLTANPVEANTAYHLALGQAVGDGALKASTVAAAGHARLGSIEAISEGNSSILCKTGEHEFGGAYKGAEPDSGSAAGPLVAAALASTPVRSSPPHKAKKPATHKKTRRHRRLLAHKAEVTPTCEIEAQLTLVYGLE